MSLIIRYNIGHKASVVGHNSKAGWVRSVAVAAREYHRAGVKDCLAVDAGLMVALGHRVASMKATASKPSPAINDAIRSFILCSCYFWLATQPRYN